MTKYLVFDKFDMENQGLKNMLKSAANTIEASSPEKAALIFIEEWGDQHCYHHQTSDYYVYVFPHQAAELWFGALPDTQAEQDLLQVAMGYRGYKTWSVEEGIDEQDPDLIDEEEDDE